jgi:rhomboid protease GluP
MNSFTPHPENSDPRETPGPNNPPRSAGGSISQPETTTIAVDLPTVKPVVVYVLIGLTVLIYILQMASTSLLGGDLPAYLGMKVNEFILRGQVWRFFTPMLLHGSILHIVFNMYALYNLGPALERHYGHGRFLALYLAGGFAGNVLSFLLSSAPSLGSSTAIFGLLGAQGVFIYQNRRFFGGMAQRALWNILSIAGINLLIGISPGSNIDNWGHVGGLLGGTIFAWLAGPLLKVEGILPQINLVDQREDGAVWRGLLSVALIFGLLVAAAFYIRLK